MRHLPMLAGLAGLLAAVAACGGSSSAAGTTPTGSSANPAFALQEQYEKVVRKVGPAVVQISTNVGLGSGIVYDDKGDIVTNAHVVGAAKTFVVTLSGGAQRAATLIGTFPPDDLAVVRLKSATGAPKAATFAPTSGLAVGDIVLAIGNPLGLRSSVTQGIVSSLGRTVNEGNGVALASVIQTSAPINPGNSGGALADLQGRVVGIPTLAALDPQLGGGAAQGIGFAIPSDTVRKIADQLIATGHVAQSGRAALGVRVATLLDGGVLVAGVDAGGAAAKAGIKPGDRILAVNHKPVQSTDELAAALAALKPGQTVPVEIVGPNGTKRTVQVKLGQLAGP
jgi:putative serine protease PepD